MVDESGEAGPAKDVGTANKRPAAAIGVAAFIIFVVVVLYLYNGITALFDLGVLGSGPVLPLVEGDSLTEAGRALVAAGFELAYGVGSLIILVGFLRGQRWAWVAAMTWITVSLAIGLWRYLDDRPQYLSMFAGVVLVLVLNLSAVHRAFNIGRR